MREEINWSKWILEKNEAAKLEELKKSNEVTFNKAYINAPQIPKGSCDCGAHSTGSHMHSDWCSGLKPPGEDITFKHKEHIHLPQTGKHGARPLGAVDSHVFDVYHKGNHIGTATAHHESDQIDPMHIDINNDVMIANNDVMNALENHLSQNAKKYMDMSPTYGK
jgi:hypothetical protein